LAIEAIEDGPGEALTHEATDAGRARCLTSAAIERRARPECRSRNATPAREMPDQRSHRTPGPPALPKPQEP
jgi:hypothetical protein